MGAMPIFTGFKRAFMTSSSDNLSPQTKTGDQANLAPQRTIRSAKIMPLPWRRTGLGSDERAFLPAALEIVETPASPVGRAIAGAIISFVTIATAWACIGHVDIIATAKGKIIPNGRVKIIQPLEAGVVTAILVKDGDTVRAGDVLVQLDETTTTADRDRARYDLGRAKLDVTRLMALSAGIDHGFAPQGFEAPQGASESDILRTRMAMNAQAQQQVAKIAALNEQIAQKTAELATISATAEKLETSLPFLIDSAEIREKTMKMEFGNRIAFLDAALRVSEQKHEMVVQHRHAGEVDAARRALEAQREQTRAEYARGIANDLADADQKAAQHQDELVKAEKKFEERTLRAPIGGTVQQLAIHTLGGVVSPAQSLLIVVPSDASIEIEAMVLNDDVGFVHEGDKVEIKVDTFNFTRYGLLHGKVTNISRDAIVRDQTDRSEMSRASERSDRSPGDSSGQSLLYTARIDLDQNEIQVDDRIVSLAPGMAVTAEIQTGRRRIIEYLLSPVLRYKQESLRER